MIRRRLRIRWLSVLFYGLAFAFGYFITSETGIYPLWARLVTIGFSLIAAFALTREVKS